MNLKKIVILFGKVNKKLKDEYDVLMEVQEVSKACKELDYKPVLLPVTLNLDRIKKALKKIKPLCVFNLIESIESKGIYIHLVPALLEELNLHYTGASLENIILTSNKIIAKNIFSKNNIPTPKWSIINKNTNINGLFLPPYIVKSQWEHASIGLTDKSVVFNKNELQSLIKTENFNNKNWFIESFIDGREFNIPMLEGKNGPEFIPPSEIVFKNYESGKPKIIGYDAKWEEDSKEYQNTLRTFDFSKEDKLLIEKLKRISLVCWNVFNLKGYARVDFRVDKNREPWVLEININPCISPDSGFFAAIKRKGLSYTGLVKRLIDAALYN